MVTRQDWKETMLSSGQQNTGGLDIRTQGFLCGGGRKAAARMCDRRRWKRFPLDDAERILLHLLIRGCPYGRRTGSCAVRKDGGDDPDATNVGHLVYAEVTRSEDAGIRISGGPGVRAYDQTRLQQPVGEAANNRVSAQHD